MSSAPPGWHRQPDGRDRYWDGERWTDEFRDPSEAATQQIPLDETRGMPATPSQSGYASQSPGGGAPGGPAGQDPYAQPPSAYGGQPYAYGEGGPLSDQSRGSGVLKGCLIALLVVAILAALLVVAGVWFFRSASDSVSESIETALPTALPSDLPTDLPTDLPSDVPTALPTDLPTDLPTLPGQGDSVEAGIGEEFTLGGATIQDGWSLSEATLGFKTVTMTAIPAEESAVPLLFSLSFLQGDSEVSSTVCTVPMGTAGEPTDVACVPVRGDVDAADSVRATGLGG